MPRSKRLPRRVHLGRGYVVEVALASQATLKDVLGEDDVDSEFSGAFDSMMGEIPAGRIYIFSRLPNEKKWETYWHELNHALVDISAWDKEHPVVI